METTNATPNPNNHKAIIAAAVTATAYFLIKIGQLALAYFAVKGEVGT